MSIFKSPPPARWAKAHCPHCNQEQSVMFTALTLRICITTHEACYRFVCPTCRTIVVTPIHFGPVVDFMIDAGIHVECWRMPLEVFEDKTHPPITADDLEWFKQELESL